MKFSRREFLSTTLAGSAAVGMAAADTGLQAPVTGISRGADTDHRESLRAAMDEIIPAGDGMPSASEAGGLDYLERVGREEPQIAAEIKQALEAIAQSSQSRFHTPFAGISPPQRVEILAAIEKSSPDVFAKLRDHVYESYYTQPRVWKLIGYEFNPTNESGPRMKPFDESVLARVKKMPKLYREVSEG